MCTKECVYSTTTELHTPCFGSEKTQSGVFVEQFEHALLRTSRALRTNRRADLLTSNVDQKVLIQITILARAGSDPK